MIDQDVFLKKYNVSKLDFENTGLIWSDLSALYQDYQQFKEQLEPSAQYLFNTLMKSPKVHSVRYRIKDPEHLVQKIIRKKIESKDSDITIANYKDIVTDLIGLRALHLYKDEWEPVNDYIREVWPLKGKPVANYRKGDPPEIIDFFIKKDCETKEHKYGYRSVHYIIETQPAKAKYLAEIQVRTIFEEAWAEIDHTIRYPYDMDNSIFFQFLLILNRLAGSADEMGSYIKFLKKELERKDAEYKQQLDGKSKLVTDLEAKVKKLNLQGQQLAELQADLDALRNQSTTRSLLDLITLPGVAKPNIFFTGSDAALGPIILNPNIDDSSSHTIAFKSLFNTGGLDFRAPTQDP